MTEPENTIIIDEEINQGQPSIPSGHTVLQIVDLLEGDTTIKDVSDTLGVETDHIEAASEYYRKHRREMEELRSGRCRVDIYYD